VCCYNDVYCCATLKQQQMAAQTEGFSGAELAGIVRAAAAYALDRASQRGFSNAAAAKVTLDDFDRGLRDVAPSTAVARQRAASASAATATTTLAVT
jgi:SpoVK/Ycf46/Vps4 family AAA+-type ATPase